MEQEKQLDNPDHLVTFENVEGSKLVLHGRCVQGIKTGDDNKVRRCFWEQTFSNELWAYYQSTFEEICFFGGLEYLIYWGDGGDGLARRQGSSAWGKKGLAISQMASLPSAQYLGEKYDSNMTAVVPEDKNSLSALIAYGLSGSLAEEVRKIDAALKPANSSFEKILFDVNQWSKIAEEQYPHGLPEPYSDDPTQWIFHGHPCGSVIWDEDAKWTAHGPLRTDDTVLQVAVARLLGYRWPAELDPEIELAEEQREWVQRCEALLPHADRDGIVCLPAVRGERRAVDRLEALLAEAFGEQWSATTRSKLLESVDHAGKDLESWLRDKFFTQHCKLFQNRPFIWHAEPVNLIQTDR